MGLTQAVPVSVAQNGKLATIIYQISTVPDDWAHDISPMDQPGESAFPYPDPATIHRGNIRSITNNPAFELWEELHE